MPVSYEQALEKLHEWTSNPALILHAKAVEASMRRSAHRFGAGAEEELRWAITGLIHDADYDRWPETHPQLVIDWLEEQGEPEIARAVATHQTAWGLEPVSPMEKSLLACDELTGFVMACCFVRPEGIHSLTPSSVKKKLKDKGFAAKIHREEVHAGPARLGVTLDEQIQLVIDALTPHAEALGIAGSNRSGEGTS